MKIEFKPHYSFEINDCKTSTIHAVFTSLLSKILGDLYHLILLSFANHYMSLSEKPFSCDKCENSEDFIWKSRHGKDTKFTTEWAEILVPQLQIQCKCCSKKMFLTRKLLGMNERKRIAHSTAKKLALIGALTTYRSCREIVSLFGSSISRTSIWKSVQKIGSQIEFSLDTDGLAEGMADGTGIPIQGIKKRGRELKVFAQKTARGGLRIAGLAIGKYESGWDAVFEPLRAQFEEMGSFHLTLDGDKAILKGLKANIEVTVQRCLWHIPHQIKYYLWKDKIKSKSDIWYKIMTDTLLLISLPKELPEEDLAKEIVKKKQEVLNSLIKLLAENDCHHCITHLNNARDDMFTGFERGIRGKTTSLVERIMRTVNLRINVGKWGDAGALNVLRIRLGYYYNGFKAMDKKEVIKVHKVA